MIKKIITSAFAAAAVGFCGAAAAAQAPLKLGAVMPMTGALQAYGTVSLNGINLAADEINAAGGVMGKHIQIKVGDTQTAPQPGVDAAQKMVNINSVVGLVGAMSSGVTIPIAQTVAKAAKVPEISNASTSPVITTLNDDDFLFRTIPSDAFQGVALAQVAKKHKVDKVAIIYVNNDYGKGLADAFTKAFKKQGGKVTQTTAYEQKQGSYRSDLQKIWHNGDTKNLVLIGYPADGQTILRESLEGGLFSHFIFTDGMKAPVLIKNLGAKYLNGSIGTTPQGLTSTPGAKHFAQAYNKKYGKLPPQPYIDTAYDAVYVLALAAEKAQTTTDSSKIRDAIREVTNPPGEKIYPGQFSKAVKLIKAGKKINWEGAAGSEDMDKNGDVAGTFAEWTIKNGEIKTVRVFNPSKQ